MQKLSIRGHWLVIMCLVSMPSGAQEVGRDEALSGALALGYEAGDIAGTVNALEAIATRFPNDAEILAYLGRGRVSGGDGAGAVAAAEQALAIEPKLAGAAFAHTQALLLNGNVEAAIVSALDAATRDDLIHGAGTRGALLLSATGLLMARGDFSAAESLLLTASPRLAGLAENAPPTVPDDIGAPWHHIQALAAIYRSTGRHDAADRLSARLTLIDENFFRGDGELGGPALWNLAATGAGRIADEQAIAWLARAVDAGFVLDWRYNFAGHPALWPLREHPRFLALIARLERETAIQ